MKFEDIGNKLGQILAPNVILSGALVALRNYFNANISLEDIFLYNIILGIVYILLWHEIRLRKLEKDGDKEQYV